MATELLGSERSPLGLTLNKDNLLKMIQKEFAKDARGKGRETTADASIGSIGVSNIRSSVTTTSLKPSKFHAYTLRIGTWQVSFLHLSTCWIYSTPIFLAHYSVHMLCHYIQFRIVLRKAKVGILVSQLCPWVKFVPEQSDLPIQSLSFCFWVKFVLVLMQLSILA